MTNLLRKVSVGVATGALFASLFATAAFANVDVEIFGNGDNSINNATVDIITSTNITQNNTTNVSPDINSSAKTGNNEASNNTGGNVSIDTGNANSSVNVSVGGSSNAANITACGCNQTVNTTISGNGVDTLNDALVTKTHVLSASQGNLTTVSGPVRSRARTGRNRANSNTNGTVNVTTGNAVSTVDVSVTAPSNTLINP